MFVATKHAEIRLRQRGIPLAVVEWLVSYGSSHFDHHRGLVFYFDSRSRGSASKCCRQGSVGTLFGTLGLLGRALEMFALRVAGTLLPPSKYSFRVARIGA